MRARRPYIDHGNPSGDETLAWEVFWQRLDMTSGELQ